MGREAEFGERVDVVGDRHAFLAGRQQRGVYRLGQPPLGDLLRECDGLEPCVGHDYTGLSLQRRAGGFVSSFNITGALREWSTLDFGLTRSRASAGAP